MTFEEIDGEGYSQLDPEHINTAFQALEDTVSGTESLTSPQRYMFAVLDASGDVTPAQRRDGNESFFGSIGNGVKVVWDYIMKMFKGIWNFFFGSSDDSITKKEEKAVATVDSNIEKMETRRKDLAEERKKELAADDEAARKRSAEIKAQHEREEEEWKQKTAKRRDEMADFAEKLEAANNTLTVLTQANEDEPEKGVVFEKLRSELSAYLRKMNSEGRTAIINKAGNIANVMEAIEVQVILKTHLKNMKSTRQPIMGIKSQVSSAVTQLEQKLKEVPKKNGYERDTINKELKSAKVFMQTMVNLEKYLSDTLSIMTKYSNWLVSNYKL